MAEPVAPEVVDQALPRIHVMLGIPDARPEWLR